MQIKNITEFRKAVYKELYDNIIPFWTRYAMDFEYGGYYGRIKNNLAIEKKARKSLILTARIIWSFSTLYHLDQKEKYLKMAEHGYRFLMDKFFDQKYGGTFWLVDYEGVVLDAKKKIYGQAFTIYALVEYYTATGTREALDNAVMIFNLIEKNNHDKQNFGYFEASNRDWSTTEEMRLSEVDMNEVKSMNTHLHLMEAYSALYRVWKDEKLKIRLEELVSIFLDYIIDMKTYHLKLFFDELWKVKSNTISFGHDIETSWLLCEAADLLDSAKLKTKIEELGIKMVDVTLGEGFSKKNAIYTERNEKGILLKNIQWWQQAEAVVGLLNAFKISGDEKYLIHAQKAWDFIETYFADRKNGEWFYEITEDNLPEPSYNKVSEWKGPYHNIRACLEIIKRLSY